MIETKEKTPLHPLMECVRPFLVLISLVLVKMITFGQQGSFMEKDFTTFVHNLLTIPYYGGKVMIRVDTSSFSEEQIQQALHSQAIKHANIYIIFAIKYFSKVNHLLWPTTLYLLIVTSILKCCSKFILSYLCRQRLRQYIENRKMSRLQLSMKNGQQF